MAKYLPYSRRELRRRQASWVKRNLKLVLLGSAFVFGALAGLTVLVLVLGTPTAFTYYTLGVTHATVIGSFLHLMNSAFLAHDREGIRHVRGAWGEENTRSELQRARRKRLIWGWVDSINLKAGDLDHLVVTRRGGLVALDSKWRSQASAGDNHDMAAAASKAKLRAEGLARTLLTNDRSARHRGRSNPLSVTSVVVLWGPVQHEVPLGAEIDGIAFVAGRQLVEWLRQLDHERVTKDAASDVLKRLTNYRALAWGTTGDRTR